MESGTPGTSQRVTNRIVPGLRVIHLGLRGAGSLPRLWTAHICQEFGFVNAQLSPYQQVQAIFFYHKVN